MKEKVPSRVSHLRYLVNGYITQELSNRGIYDLHTSYGGIIYHLQNHQSLTMKELAKKIDRDKSTLTPLIKKLVKDGYVTLSVNETDKRSKVVCITEKGIQTEQHFKDVSNALYQQLWIDINEEDSDVFEKVLEQLINNLEKEGKK